MSGTSDHRFKVTDLNYQFSNISADIRSDGRFRAHGDSLLDLRRLPGHAEREIVWSVRCDDCTGDGNFRFDYWLPCIIRTYHGKCNTMAPLVQIMAGI